MRERNAIFLDLDGVLVDNGPALMAAFGRAVSEELRGRLGGDVEGWTRAHTEAYRNAPPTPVGLSPAEVYRWEHITGVRETCLAMGLEPPGDDECVALAQAIGRRVREIAPFLPGAGDAVRQLRRTHAMHMSSGNAAGVVEEALVSLGVREHVGVMCGCELVDVMKTSEEFYPRVFALAGVEAREAIVVDDRLDHLERARGAGAATVLVAAGLPSGGSDVDLVVRSLAELAGVLMA